LTSKTLNWKRLVISSHGPHASPLPPPSCQLTSPAAIKKMGKAKVLLTPSDLQSNFWDGNKKKRN